MAQIIRFPKTDEQTVSPEEALLSYLHALSDEEAAACLASFIQLRDDGVVINNRELENVYSRLGFADTDVVLCRGFIEELVNYYCLLLKRLYE